MVQHQPESESESKNCIANPEWTSTRWGKGMLAIHLLGACAAAEGDRIFQQSRSTHYRPLDGFSLRLFVQSTSDGFCCVLTVINE